MMQVQQQQHEQDQRQLLAVCQEFLNQQQRLLFARDLNDMMMKQLDETLDVVTTLEEQRVRLIAAARLAIAKSEGQPVQPVAAMILSRFEAGSALHASEGASVEPPAQALAATSSASASSASGNVASQELHNGQRSSITTLMVRGIPKDGSQEMLIDLWPPASAECPYNMLYAPKRPKRNGLQGYAYINFTTSDAADRFRARWEGVQPPPCHGVEWHGPLSIVDSDFQGLDANLKIYDGNKLDSMPEFRWPKVFGDGALLDFGTVMADFRRRAGQDPSVLLALEHTGSQD
jgi:hypothetical protein